MRRLARWVFTLYSALSLASCAAVLALWVRSYWVTDSFHWSAPRQAILVVSADGELRLEHIRRTDWYFDEDPGFEHKTFESDGHGAFPARVPGRDLHFRAYGFALVTGPRWGDDHHALFLPAWFLFALLVAPPAAWWTVRARRARRQRDGLCPSCGYDLRGSPHRCPECGTPAPPPEQATI